MNEYVKVLLRMYPKLNTEKKRLDRNIEYKALTSHSLEQDVDLIMEQIFRLQLIRAEYEEVHEILKRALLNLSKEKFEAICFRFFKGEQPKDQCLRTIYRRTVIAIEEIRQALEAEGYDQEWFFHSCMWDIEMLELYRYYCSQTPTRYRNKNFNSVK